MAGLDLLKLKSDAGDEAEQDSVPASVATVPREIVITVNYTSPDGKKYSAALTSSILSGDNRARVARMAAGILGGVNWDTAPAASREYAYMLAWITFSISNPPDWFTRWVQEDSVLLLSMYGEVELHEREYFLGSPNQGNGGSPRLQVSSALSARPTKKRNKPTEMGS